MVSASGLKGDTGAGGQSAYTTTTASYTQPSVSSNVSVSVLSTSWMAAGQRLYITTGGDYEVVSITSPTVVSLKNSGYPSNAAPTTVIATNQSIVTSGIKGDTGATGSVSSASSLVLNYTTIPTTAISQLGIYADTITGLLRVRKQSNGIANTIALLDQDNWKYSLFYG